MKCKQCGDEFVPKRATAQYCKPACRVKAGRVSVTKEKVSVTKNGVSVTDDTVKKVSVTNPLKRITRAPDRVPEGYYESETYLNLIEELELKPIKQLEEERYFVPTWKHAGHKNKLDITKILKEV